MIRRLRDAVWRLLALCCRYTDHWFKRGWVACWMNYEAGKYTKSVYFRRCQICGEES